ncbi:MAG: nuclear transport factor 2 family protein [Gaiellaceae bacterium]
MSKENVELVRRIHNAWDRGESMRELVDSESMRELVAEDVEYVNPPYAVEPGTRRGRGSFALVTETIQDFELRIDRFVDAGGEDVVVLAHYSGSGRSSGVPVSGEQGYVWTVRDGSAVRFRWFLSHREALEAAGVAE